MPTIVQTVSGKITGLWGAAMVRGADGKMHALKVGDIVHKGDVILTAQNGIVQLSPDDTPAPRKAPGAASATADIDRVISEINDNDPKAAPAAGAAEGALSEGLRVGRVVENVTPLAFEYGLSDRGSEADISGTAVEPTAPEIAAVSSVISAVENGTRVGLGLRVPAGTPPGATVTVNELPLVGQVFKADDTPVTVGMVLTQAELEGLQYEPPTHYANEPVGPFVYTITNGTVSAVGSTTITVAPVNEIPALVDDVATGPEGSPITGNVLANDRDPDGDTVTVTTYRVGGVDHPAGQPAVLAGVGTLVINADGSYRFTPLPDYSGPVPVATYTATDGALTSTATLTLAVTPVNDPPVAGDDIASTPINQPIDIPVLANDTDADGDVLTVSGPVLADPTQGTVTVNPDGTLRFVPATNLTGPVTITYTVTDPNGATDTATVVVNVGNNTPPDSANRAVTTTEDTPVTLSPADFAFTDADVGQTLNAVRIDTLPASGTLLLNGTPVVAGTLVSAADIANGNLSFEPAANANGVPYAAFAFTVQDSGGAFDTTPNTLTLTVTPVNDPPIAAPDAQRTPEDTPVTMSIAALLGNDTDADGDPLTLDSVQAPLHGTVAIVGGDVVFTPDPDYAGPASFTYTVSDGNGGTSTTTVNIVVEAVVDPAISISDVTVNEAAGTATFTVTLSEPTSATVTVRYQSADGTAVGADYTAQTGTLTFAPNVTSQTVTVPIANDAVYERSESFNVVLSQPTNGTLADGTGVGTILDDGTGPGGSDNDAPRIAVSAVDAVEGTPAVFTVSLSNPSTAPVVFTPSLVSGTATVGTDTSALPALEVSTDGGSTWLPVAGNATIPAGATSVQLRLPTTDDAIQEPTENLTLVATPVSGAAPVPASAVANIIDADGPPALSINDVTVNEAAGTMTFTVTLAPVSGQTVTVDFTTATNSATAGADFTATSGTLTFAPNVTTQTIVVPISNDATFEGSETFNVVLSNAVNADVADGLGVGTIRDDGTGPGGSDDDTPRVGTVSSPTNAEGGDLDFAVALTNPSTTPTVVTLTPASGSATLGTDTAPAQVSFDGGLTFSAVTGPTVTVPPGVTDFIVRVPALDDTLSEQPETITLAAGTSANAAPVVGTGTITDTDGSPTLAISGPLTVDEAAGTVTFTVTMSNPSSTPVSVNFGTTNGTATAGSDFTANTGTLNFAPGVTSQTVTVAITDDATFERTETFSVVLSGASGAVVTTDTATTTITDDGTGPGASPDDDTPAVGNVSSPTVVEGNNLDFSVTLTNPSTTPTVVTLAPASGTATLGTDTQPALVSFDGGVTFAPVVGTTVAVPAGATSFIVRVPTQNDSLAEPTETMTLAASTPTNAAPVTGTGTITDNDAPVLNIAGPAVIDEAAGTATYTVTLSNPSATAVTVNYASANGSATAGADYVATSGTLNFAPGETSKTITVSINNDTTLERSETLTMNLAAPSGAAIGIGSVASEIVDDGRGLPGGGTASDDTPSLAIAAISVAEGAPAVFTVTLSNPSTSPVVFTPSLASGSATLGTDTAAPAALEFFNGAAWVPVAGNVTIAPGATSVQLRLATTDDATSEPNETFTLTATPVSGSTPAPASAVATIVDNDGAPQFSVNDVTVNEGTGTITFTVSLSNPAAGAVSVSYAAASATANVPADVSAGLSALAGTLNFAAGVTSQTITLNVANDVVFEGAETFAINLSAATGGTLIADAQGIGTIRDDGTGPGGSDNDTPQVGSVSSPTVVEGSNLDFAVTLTHPSTTPTTVTLVPASGTATVGTDTQPALVSFDGGTTFVPIVGATVSVPAGATSFIVRVPTVNDTTGEPTEAMTLAASTPANTAPVVGTGTITDNDTPVVSITGPALIDEAAGTATYTVTLSNPSSTAVTVNYATANGTATAGADYTAATGTLSFAPGVTSQTVTVAIANDGTFEGAETLNVNLSAPSGATLGTATVASQIVDDGRALPGGPADNDTPVITLAGPALIDEAAGTATYTVTLSNPSAAAVTVAFATANGTATAGSDYTAASGTLTFAPGATSQTITVAIADDGTFEGAETLTVNLSAPTGATLGTATVTSQIVDDGRALPGGPANNDAPAVGTVSSPTVVEGNNLDFTVTLTNASTTPTTVTLAPASGTATLGTDTSPALVSFDGGTTFVLVVGTTVSVPAGATSFIVRVPTVNDVLGEPTEAMTLGASTPVNTAPIIGTGTITDNDTPVVSISGPVTYNEAAGTATYTVTLSNAATTPVTVGYATANGTATAADFTAASGTLTFAPGVTSQTITVALANDTTFEGSESFTVNLSAPTGATLGTATSTTTIVDDGTGTGGTNNDRPAVGTVSSPTVVEGNNLDFTVTLTNASTTPTTVTLAPASGTATLGTDTQPAQVSFDGGTTFVPVVGTTVSVPAGATSFIVRVPTVNDPLGEPTEAMTLGASTPVNTAPVVGTGTITDNDTPVVSISGPVTYNEAAGTATYTVTLSNAATTPVTVGYATANGTATAADFTAGSGTLTFAPGVTSQTITVALANDTTFEGSESFTVNLSAPTGATLGTATSTTTIVDDGTGTGGTNNDRPAVGTVSSPTVVEGGNLDFAVTLTNASTTPTTVTLAPASGTATLGTDTQPAQVSFDGGTTFVPVVGTTVSVPAGATSFIVRVPTVNDPLGEPTEAMSLGASTPVNTVPVVGTGTITDNDTPVVSISGPVTYNEAAGTASYTVTLSTSATTPVTVNYATANGTATAGADYTAGSGTLTFAPGVTSQTITVALANDTTFEGSESFTVNLSAPVGANLGTATSTTTIVDNGTGTGGTNDDRPAVGTVSSPTVVEGNNLDFTVTLTNASTTPTTVTLAPASGTAALGTDTSPALVSFDGGTTFVPVVGTTVSVPAGATSFIVRVPTVNDTLGEPTEAMTLGASTPVNTAPIIGTGTITDNDTPVVSISGPVTYNEAAGTATYTVTLSNAATTPVTVGYATANGTATAADFTAASGTLTFAPGVTSQTITVALANDTTFEGSESFTVNLSAPTGATLGTATSTTTIVDDGTGTGGTNNDRPAVGTVSSPTVVEGNNLDFTVTLTNPSTTPTTVTLAPASGTATLGTDTQPAQVSFDGGTTFVPVVGTTVSVPAGATSFIVRVPTVNDPLGEPTEAMSLGASTPVNTAPVVGTGTITDNDTPVVSISGPVTYNEAAGTATYTVTLSNAATTPVTVGYATANGTATAADFTAGSGTLTFAPGVTSQTITVALANDTTFEGSESFTVNLSAPTGATLGTATSTTTIVDDGTGTGGTNNDRPAVGTVSSPTVVEGGNLDFAVTLTNPSTTPTTVTLAPASGTATLGTDTQPAQVSFDGGTTFVPVVGTTVSVPAGATSFIVRVPTVNDVLGEPNETMTLGASTPVNTVPVVGTGTITDNDTPVVSISGPVTYNEAAGTASYTVTLSTSATTPVTVNYATANGTATAGADYTAGSGTLTFAPGVTSQTITVALANDTTFEGSESFTVNLSAPVGANLGTATSTTTIVDNGTGTGGTNNDTPVINISGPVTYNEAAGTATYTVTLTNASTAPVTVGFATANGTATAGADFTAGSGTLTFAPGVTSQTITVALTNDTTFEGSENFTVNLSAPTGATLGTATSTTTIVDNGTGTGGTNNDRPAVGTVSSPTVVEGNNLDFTVTLTNASTTPTTVTLAPASGTATLGTDTQPAQVSFDGGTTFVPVVGTTVSVPAGATSFIVRVPTVNDTGTEPTEAMTLAASTPVNTVPIVGTGTITDNDAPPVLDLDANNSSTATGANYRTTFTENGAAVSIGDTDVTVTDVDSANLTGATITLTNAQAGDLLAAGAMPAGITAAVVGNVVTLSGAASLANYQTAIRAITFANTTETPNTTARAITVVVTDGTSNSNVATTTVNVVAVNDAPIAVANTNTATEDVPLTTTAVTGVLANDSDLEGSALNVTQFTVAGVAGTFAAGTTATIPTVGTLVINANGSYTFTPALHYSGAVPVATYTVSDGAATSTSTLTLTVTPVADVPTLTVLNNSAEVFRTGWETAANANNTSQPVAGPTLEGWTLMTAVDPFPQNSQNFFEVWNQTTDTMANQAGTAVTFAMAAGNGNQAVELNNATNGVNPQTLGIERSVATVAGQVYTLSFDYAGRLGFNTDFTRIKVTVDGQVINFADTSSQTALDWRTLSFSFTGDGTAKVVRIETDPIVVNAAGRGALIDDITLNHAQGAIAGNAVGGTKTDIGLDRYIDATRVDNDGSETLTLTLNGLPTGAQVVTGVGTYDAVNGSITFSATELATANLRVDSGFFGNLQIGVTATSTETANGASASSAAQTLNLAVAPQTGTTVDPSVKIMGGLGNDTLIGDVGSQTLYGGRGNDTLTGDTDSDTFRWSLGDRGAVGTPAADIISDFSTATAATGGDVLDLRDLLVGENRTAGVGNLQNYLDFDTTSVAGQTTIRISSSGGFTGGTYAAGAEDQRITLTGVDLRTGLGLTAGATDNQIIQELLNRNKLVTDA